ncbi:MAG: hypothetical protein J6E44_10055 [Lachnospiraceae bacterium]|nr:hypothetical protein [Lachnospiraceae bacterium]
MTKRTVSVLTAVMMLIMSAFPVGAGAIIRKPYARSANASVHYKGSTTYYNTNSQTWKKMKSSFLYSCKGKLDTKYYRPVIYLCDAWLSNNGQNLGVHLGRSKSISVSKAVQSSLGIRNPNVDLATSVSRSYSKTISTSYSTDYTFVMKNYSRRHRYKPAYFGNIYKYCVLKSNRLLKRTSALFSYTYKESDGLDLRLAWK